MKPRSIPRLSIAILMLAIVTRSLAADWPAPDPAAVAHWQSLRFGMFIHWDPSSQVPAEISWSRGRQIAPEKYDQLYKTFDPEKFNADDWVGIAKAAGMKYIVMVVKHHDGFCMWDTKYTDYNIMNTPFHRDPVKELSDACKRQGIAFGCYYSQPDVHNPNWPMTRVGGGDPRPSYDLNVYEQYVLNQITELIKNYGPLITIWNDSDGTTNAIYGKRGADTIKLGRQLQPDILFNNRTGDGGDYRTPEQVLGGFDMDHPWESCMTVSAHGHWSWAGPGDGVKSPATCIRLLAHCAGGDGNMLLDVGPRPDGIIDPAQAGLLKQIGDWMAVNGESIYGTRGGPFLPNPWGVSTRKGNTIYLHVLSWKNDSIRLPPFPARIVSARALNGAAVTCHQATDGTTVAMPAATRDPADTVIALELDSPATALTTIKVAGWPTLATGATATASNIYRNDPQYAPSKAIDGDPDTRWATDNDAHSAWIAIDMGAPRTFSRITIHEEYGSRVQKFELKYQDANGQWQPVFDGTTIGPDFQKSFQPVTSRAVRLNILSSVIGPTISEIGLYK